MDGPVQPRQQTSGAPRPTRSVGPDVGSGGRGGPVRDAAGALRPVPTEARSVAAVTSFSDRSPASDRVGIDVVRLDHGLPLPAYARSGDAGIDLFAREAVVIRAGGGRALVPTGVAIALPIGYGGFVLPRSGLAWRHGVTVVNAPGLIDAGYRDELKVALINTDPETDYAVARGDRIAQLVVQRVATVDWREVESLDGENRGGGFGHTGR